MNDKTIFLAKVRDIAEINLANPDLNGELISKELEMSRMHLHRLLKEYGQENASNFILDIRINYAKTEIAKTEKPIYTIAKEIGFNDPSYFSKVFKKKTGLSPSEYRNY